MYRDTSSFVDIMFSRDESYADKDNYWYISNVFASGTTPFDFVVVYSRSPENCAHVKSLLSSVVLLSAKGKTGHDFAENISFEI